MKISVHMLTLAILISSSAAFATSGTISGRYTSTERRVIPGDRAADVAATRWNPGTRTRGDATEWPLQNALVRVRINTTLRDGSSSHTYEFFTKTNDNGEYLISWDISNFRNITSANATLFWERPDIDNYNTYTSRPSYKFKVTNDAGFVYGYTTSVTPSANNNVVRSTHFTLSSRDRIIAAYFSANEVMELLREMDSTDSMYDDIVGANLNLVSFIDAQTAAVPNDHTVHLLLDRHVDDAEVGPHELGHLIAWRQLDIFLAPYNFFDYDECFGSVPGRWNWDLTSRECEKIAFWEGFATFIEAAWLFERTATTPEVADLRLENVSTGLCSIPRGKNRALCQAAIIWDFYDDPRDPITGSRFDVFGNPLDDDDIKTRTLASISRTLEDYPRGCAPFIDNRCSNERGYFQNAYDFRANFDRWSNSADVGRLSNIIIQNGSQDARN